MTDPVAQVLEVNAKAVKRGALSIWTVYNRPKDHSTGYMARRHEVVGGEERSTMDTLKADLEDIQEIFLAAGLTRLTRDETDDPVIVESWL
jgi:hypothetical protein